MLQRVNDSIQTAPRRKRQRTPEERAQIVKASLAPGADIHEVADRFECHKSAIYQWRRAAAKAEAEQKAVPVDDRLEKAFRLIREAFADAREAGREDVIAKMTEMLERPGGRK